MQNKLCCELKYWYRNLDLKLVFSTILRVPHKNSGKYVN